MNAVSGISSERSRGVNFAVGFDFQGYAGKRGVGFGPTDAPRANRRIHYTDGAATGPLEHDEVIQRPVEDGRGVQLPELAKFQAHRTTAESQTLGKVLQPAQARTPLGNAQPGTMLVQGSPVAMMRGYHGDAREPALRTVGLQDGLDALHGPGCVVPVPGIVLKALGHATQRFQRPVQER